MSRFLLLGLACLLAACGQKGPLYLPAPPAPVASPAVTAPVQAAPAPTGEQDKQDEKDTQDSPAATPQP